MGEELLKSYEKEAIKQFTSEKRKKQTAKFIRKYYKKRLKNKK